MTPAPIPAMIKADTPNLWTIRNNLGRVKAIAILVNALVQTARLINVENNLTEAQIGELANDILDEYGFLKPVEVKAVLKRGLRSKIFGRLDYNIIIEWFDDYICERTSIAMDISDQEETQAQNKPVTDVAAVGWEEYLLILKERAKSGEKAAQDILAQVSDGNKPMAELGQRFDARKKEKEMEFQQWKAKYTKQKQNQ